MPTAHIVIEKEINFRGQAERFGNGYNFQLGSNEATLAFIKSVADALVTMERNFHSSAVKFPYRVGGLVGEDAVYAEEVSSPPTGNAAFTAMHPETCLLAQSQIGPKRYLMKYYHTLAHGGQGGSTDPDVVNAATKTAVNGFLLKLTDGTLPGGVIYCRPNGALATAPLQLDGYHRTHQLKRRGRRPT
jgi:hypothetical protein